MPPLHCQFERDRAAHDQKLARNQENFAGRFDAENPRKRRNKKIHGEVGVECFTNLIERVGIWRARCSEHIHARHVVRIVHHRRKSNQQHWTDRDNNNCGDGEANRERVPLVRRNHSLAWNRFTKSARVNPLIPDLTFLINHLETPSCLPFPSINSTETMQLFIGRSVGRLKPNCRTLSRSAKCGLLTARTHCAARPSQRVKTTAAAILLLLRYACLDLFSESSSSLLQPGTFLQVNCGSVCDCWNSQPKFNVSMIVPVVADRRRPGNSRCLVI